MLRDSSFLVAFGQNLMMSVLFISMLYQRQSLRGQSIWIAISKMLGTGCASLACFFYAEISQSSILMPFLYIAIFIYDLIYLVAVGSISNSHFETLTQENTVIKEKVVTSMVNKTIE